MSRTKHHGERHYKDGLWSRSGLLYKGGFYGISDKNEYHRMVRREDEKSINEGLDEYDAYFRYVYDEDIIDDFFYDCLAEMQEREDFEKWLNGDFNNE